jgi:hypothetical protein
MRHSTGWFWVLAIQLLVPAAALGAILIGGAAL